MCWNSLKANCLSENGLKWPKLLQNWPNSVWKWPKSSTFCLSGDKCGKLDQNPTAIPRSYWQLGCYDSPLFPGEFRSFIKVFFLKSPWQHQQNKHFWPAPPQYNNCKPYIFEILCNDYFFALQNSVIFFWLVLLCCPLGWFTIVLFTGYCPVCWGPFPLSIFLQPFISGSSTHCFDTFLLHWSEHHKQQD